MTDDSTEPTEPTEPTVTTKPTEPTEPTVTLDPSTSLAPRAADAETVPLDPPTPSGTLPALPVAPPTPPAYVPPVALDTAAAGATPAAPRVRWAGIVWGTVFALLAATALWVLGEASRIEAIGDWLRTLSPGEFRPGWVIGIVVLAGGVLLLLVGGLALIRNVQLRGTVDR